MIRILHTSDWHLGRTLYGRRRYEEFEAFLDWLSGVIDEEEVDVLLIAGDVFDTSAPGSRAQELYYRFLAEVSLKRSCRVVVTAGNHDSPSLLGAPRQLLRAMRVDVVGTLPEDLGEEVVRFEKDGEEVLICAVPYLREQDVRRSEAGEEAADKEAELAEGIREHYRRVADAAAGMQTGLFSRKIAMGHLFVTGGKTVDGDGVRDLYVGSLGALDSSLFPEDLDYVALGHLHVPQVVGGNPCIRYSGSPLPMGFGEAAQTKSVVLVDLADQKPPEIRLREVPRFQQLSRISGDRDQIESEIHHLIEGNASVWIEVEYTGSEPAGDLREHLAELIEGSAVEIRRIRNPEAARQVLERKTVEESLDDIQVEEVFTRLLGRQDFSEEAKVDLTGLFSSVLRDYQDRDLSAE